ncbi:MAG: hypothetical protein AB8G96_01065 [Phycisphaerales bacterium]
MLHSAPTGRGRRPSLLVVVLALVVAALIPAPMAMAQLGGPAAPGPISSRELNGYAEMLGLTPQQRAALDPLHDAYKRQYDTFRRTDVVEFEALERETNLNGGLDVSREEVATLFDASDRLLRQVARFDQQFFDQAQSVLTPAQAARLPRVRLARERTRLDTGNPFGGMPGMQIVDLAVVSGRTIRNLTPAEQAELDGIMIPYEQRLTRHRSKTRKATQTMMLNILDSFENAGLMGITEEEMQTDPEIMAAVMEVAQTAFTDASRELADASADATKSNLRTMFTVMRTVPVAQARGFRREIMANGGIAGAFGLPWPSDAWADALRIGDLDSLRPAVQAGLESSFANELATSEPLIRRAGEAFSGLSPMDGSGMQEAVQEAQKATESLLERMAALTETANAEIAALLGEDWRSRISTGNGDDVDGAIFPSGFAFGGAVDSATLSAPVSNFENGRFDSMLPGRVPWSDLDQAVGASDAGDEAIAAAEAAYETYRNAFNELPTFATLREKTSARQQMMYGDERTSDIDAIAAASRSVNQARRAAMGELEGLDTTLFAAATEASGGDPTGSIARLAQRRARERWMSGAEFAAVSTADARAAGMDPYTVVTSANLPASDEAIAFDVLDQWSQSTIDLAQQSYESRLQFDVAQQNLQIRLRAVQESMTTDGEDFDTEEWQELYAEYQETPQQELNASLERISESLHAVSEQIASSVSPDGRRQFELAMRTARYPTVYNDPACVIGHLERALELDDLDPDQAARLARLLAEYREQWTGATDRIVEMIRTVRRNTMSLQGADWRELQAKDRELTELSFERGEFSTRAANQIRLVLREDQIVRLGGLPDPDAESSISVWSF